MLRTNPRTKAMSPHDGATPAIVANGKTARKGIHGTYTKSGATDFDFTRPLVWDATGDWATEFNALVKNPPLHSVVIEIWPEVADQLLKLSNTKNRPKKEGHSKRLGSMAEAHEFELTGDTIKFGKSGTLLDGQHRLDGAVKCKTPLTSHVVFGIDDALFDLLDQGKKRTAADVLAMCGVPDPTLVAGAIGWVFKIENKEGGILEGGGRQSTKTLLTPRKIRSLALGPMKTIVDYLKDARLVNIAYKHPPTMVCGLLYLIGRHDAGVARDFAHEWATGARTGRNKNFDVLQQRINQIAHGNNGVVSRAVRAALLIQTFNHWHAHVIASPRALTWRKGWAFPELEFNPGRFKEGKATEARESTALPDVKYRVHYVLTQMQDKKGFVAISLDEIAKLANVSRGSVQYILGELARTKQISPVRSAITTGKRGAPGTYQVLVPAAEIKQVAS